MSVQAVEYVRAGLALVEIRPNSKAPKGKNWQQIANAITTEAQAAAVPEGTGLGIAHRWCKTCALDIDDLRLAATWFTLHGLDLDAKLKAPSAVQDVSGREGRAKLIYRLPEGVEWLKTVKPAGSGFELRNATADGLTVQDVVAPSIHPETGKPYAWRGNWRAIPTIPAPLLAVWQGLVAPATKPKLNGANGAARPTRSLEELKEVLIHIPADEYETWIKVGMGLHENFHGDDVGLEAWEDWSKSSEKFQADDCREKWASFRPNGGVTCAAIFGMAKAAGAPVAEIARARNVRAAKPIRAAQAAPSMRPAPPPSIVTYQTLGLPLNNNGQPVPNMYCALRVLRGVERWAGRVHYDTFMLKILIDGIPLTEKHNLEFLEYLQSELGIGKFPPQAAAMALRAYAFANERDSALEWLMSLPEWDGVRRCASIFPDLFGAERNEYSEAVGVNFMRSMCARILKPGCMVKHMVILEGAQDAGKSKMLRLLVGKDFFTEQHERADSREFFMVFEGKLLNEISELDSFRRAEVTRIKQVISCECDRYRAPYGMAAEDHPRRSILVGTTNKDDYLHDDTGGVRFWPIRCTELNFDGMTEQREQLFAEARQDVLDGQKWWEMPQSAKAEQDERYAEDPWQGNVSDYCIGKNEVQVIDILCKGFDMRIKEVTRLERDRVASCLRNLGWKNVVRKQTGASVRLWIRETKKPLG